MKPSRCLFLPRLLWAKAPGLDPPLLVDVAELEACGWVLARGSGCERDQLSEEPGRFLE